MTLRSRRGAALLFSLLFCASLAGGNRRIATPVRYPAGLNEATTFTGSGDFNRDGRADFVIQSGASVLVFPGRGDGSFGAAVRTSVSGLVLRELADFNRDGAADLLLTREEGGPQFAIMLGAGGNAFASPLFVSASAPVLAVTTGDFNGDRNIDVVAILSGNRSAFYAGTGAGTFAAAVGSPGPAVFSAVTPVSGDFNGDGRADFAVIAAFNTNVFTGDGTGSFFTGPNFGGAMSGAAADVDGDGIDDIALSNGEVYLGTRSAAFVRLTVAARGMTVIAADMNRDGRREFLISDARGATFIVSGAGPGTLARPRMFVTGGTVAAADFDEDGATDVVSAVPRPQSPFTESVAFTKGNGDGTLRAMEGTNVEAEIGTQPFTPDLAIADMTGDGRPDILTARLTQPPLQLITIPALPGGGFGAAIATAFPGTFPNETSNARAQFAGDLNGDGIADMLAEGGSPFAPGRRMTVMLGRRDGRFDTGFSFNARATGFLADVNDDRRTDFVMTSGFFHAGNGSGSFGAETPIPEMEAHLMTRFVDLNRDGRSDMLWAFGNNVRARLRRADGSFAPAVATFGYGISDVADVNKDGAPDLIAGNTELGVQLGRGDGTFAEPVWSGPIPRSGGDTFAQHADIDGDGHLDVVLQGRVYFGTGDGRFDDITEIPWDISGFTSWYTIVNGTVPEIYVVAGSQVVVARVDRPNGTMPVQLTARPGREDRALFVDVVVTGSNGAIPRGALRVTAGARDVLLAVPASGVVKVFVDPTAASVTVTYGGDHVFAPQSVTATTTTSARRRAAGK